MSGIEEEKSVTTVVISASVYDCGYACVGTCGYVWIVALGILPCGDICLCRVENMVLNAPGLGIVIGFRMSIRVLNFSIQAQP